jgi:hypothetical protein
VKPLNNEQGQQALEALWDALSIPTEENCISLSKCLGEKIHLHKIKEDFWAYFEDGWPRYCLLNVAHYVLD